MFGNRGVLLPLLVLVFLFAAKAHADVSEDANRLLDWAEIHYPTLFSPAKQPSREALGYIYRYYPGSKNYAGVHIADRTAHVLGPDFGDQILNVGTLKELMAIVNSDPSTSGSGACVAVPLYVKGTRSLLVTLDNTGRAVGTTERLIESVKSTNATFSETLEFFDAQFQQFEFLVPGRQPFILDQALMFYQVGKMRVIEYGQPVRVELQDLVDGIRI